jgi:hypothetical protein
MNLQACLNSARKMELGSTSTHRGQNVPWQPESSGKYHFLPGTPAPECRSSRLHRQSRCDAYLQGISGRNIPEIGDLDVSLPRHPQPATLSNKGWVRRCPRAWRLEDAGTHPRRTRIPSLALAKATTRELRVPREFPSVTTNGSSFSGPFIGCMCWWRCAAIIRCTADPARAGKRTRSKWSRVLRYVKTPS